MNEVSQLVAEAQQQLDEHKAWLISEIEKIQIPDGDVAIAGKRVLLSEVPNIKLRMSRVDAIDSVSILWEYPDILITFLRSEEAPAHLRASLNGGRVVDLEQAGQEARTVQ